MNSKTYTFIDCDSHITEPHDLWKRYLPRSFQSYAPTTALDPSNDREYWYFGSEKVTGVAAFSWAGWPESFPHTPPTFKDIAPACYEAKLRLQWMDDHGCQAQVLFPNLIGTAGERCLKVPDAQLGLALLQAYNTYVAE